MSDRDIELILQLEERMRREKQEDKKMGEDWAWPGGCTGSRRTVPDLPCRSRRRLAC